MKHSTLHSTIFTLALALLSGCSKNDGNAVNTLADEPLPVRTLAATNAVFERATTVQGTLESVDSAIVSARIPGPLLRVCVDLGDEVVSLAREDLLIEIAQVEGFVTQGSIPECMERLGLTAPQMAQYAEDIWNGKA